MERTQCWWGYRGWAQHRRGHRWPQRQHRRKENQRGVSCTAWLLIYVCWLDLIVGDAIDMGMAEKRLLNRWDNAITIKSLKSDWLRAGESKKYNGKSEGERV